MWDEKGQLMGKEGQCWAWCCPDLIGHGRLVLWWTGRVSTSFEAGGCFQQRVGVRLGPSSTFSNVVRVWTLARYHG